MTGLNSEITLQASKYQILKKKKTSAEIVQYELRDDHFTL